MQFVNKILDYIEYFGDIKWIIFFIKLVMNISAAVFLLIKLS